MMKTPSRIKPIEKRNSGIKKLCTPLSKKKRHVLICISEICAICNNNKKHQV
jgi:hypothetical protein